MIHRIAWFPMTWSLLILCFLTSFRSAAGQGTKPSEADRAFERGKYATARQLYSDERDKIRGEENRERWKQLSMQIVRCLIAQDDMEQATEEYFLLCRIDPLISLDMIPLPWFVSVETKKGTRAREKTAEDWLDPLQTKHRGPAATLLAASILSVSGNQSKQNLGKQYLKNLASLYDTNTAEQMKAKNKSDLAAQRQQEAARLAGALLWKERIPRLKTASDLTPLRRYLEQIPEAQRAGPLFLFGLAARRTDQLEDAVLAWMRIPISYRENRPLAVEALREAAQTLEKLGRTDQAETLRREAETLSK